MVKKKKAASLFWPSLLLLVIVFQGVSLRSLRAQQRVDRENIRTAYVYLLRQTDFSPAVRALEDFVAAERITDIRGTLGEIDRQMEAMTERLLQLNNLRYGRLVRTQGSGVFHDSVQYVTHYQPVSEWQAALQEKILNAHYFFSNEQMNLYYFDGVLPPEQKAFFQAYLEQVRRLADELAQYRDFIGRQYYNQMDETFWEEAMGGMDRLAAPLVALADLKSYRGTPTGQFTPEQAEQVARAARGLDAGYRLISTETFAQMPGERLYHLKFAKGEEVNVDVSAATGKVAGYFDGNIYRASGDKREMPAEEQKERALRAAADATAALGERLVIYPASGNVVEETTTVIGVTNGLPDLSRMADLRINPAVGKVFDYDARADYAPGSLSDLTPKLSPEQALARLRADGKFFALAEIKPDTAAGAKVRRLVIHPSFYMRRPVLAYAVQFGDAGTEILLINADSGKVEARYPREFFDRLDNAVSLSS